MTLAEMVERVEKHFRTAVAGEAAYPVAVPEGVQPSRPYVEMRFRESEEDADTFDSRYARTAADALAALAAKKGLTALGRLEGVLVPVDPVQYGSECIPPMPAEEALKHLSGYVELTITAPGWETDGRQPAEVLDMPEPVPYDVTEAFMGGGQNK